MNQMLLQWTAVVSNEAAPPLQFEGGAAPAIGVELLGAAAPANNFTSDSSLGMGKGVQRATRALRALFLEPSAISIMRYI